MLAMRSIFVAVVAFSLPLHAKNEKRATNPLDNATQAIKATMDQFKVPGISIAIIDGDNIYSDGYGYATLPGTPATENTLWEAGSTTKAFTAAALAHIIDSQNFTKLAAGWQTPIASILPTDFVLADRWATAHVTLLDAATHRTGLPRHDLAWIAGNDTQEPGDIVRNLRNLPLSLEPRVALQYCNLMYLTLTHAISTLTGSRYKDLIRTIILEPLGMDSTYFDRYDAITSGNALATGYFWDRDKQEYQSRPRPNVRFYGGAGASISTVKDYAKWVKCLITQSKPFSANVHNQIRTPGMIGSAEPLLGADSYGYSLGWEKLSFHGTSLYRHSGTTATFGAGVFWLPEIKFGVVIFGNAGNAANMAEYVIAWKLMEDKLNIEQKNRYPAAEPLKQILDESADAMKHAKEILYPNTTELSIPPSADLDAFEGAYHNDGYGTLHIKQDHTDDAKLRTPVLVGRRDGFRYHIKFQHATEDHWAAMSIWEESDSLLGLYKADFVTDLYSKPTALLLNLTLPGSPIDGGTIRFERVR